jgi:hypothetical protein
MRAVERKLFQVLLDLDITEKVEDPTLWVSPIQVVPKKTNDWHLVVDMRQANVAVAREHYPVPTIKGLLNELRGGQIFSKLGSGMGFSPN